MYDLIIIGAGPAGLTASIYASCFHLRHLVIGKTLGGQLQLAPDILNYPGFLEITGKELTKKMVKQVKERGGKIVIDSVVRIQKFKIQSTKSKNTGQNPCFWLVGWRRIRDCGRDLDKSLERDYFSF